MAALSVWIGALLAMRSTVVLLVLASVASLAIYAAAAVVLQSGSVALKGVALTVLMQATYLAVSAYRSSRLRH